MASETKRTCTQCGPFAPKAETVSILGFQAEHPLWSIKNEDGADKIRRRFLFPTYAEAVKFTGDIAALAASEDHHPAILLELDAVTVTWWTHSLGGLHNNDLILAQYTDKLFTSAMKRAGHPV